MAAVVDRDKDPLWLLMCDHPQPACWVPPGTLFDPPDQFASTAKWRAYRDRLATRECLDEWRRHLLAQATLVLEWRERIPPHFRYWREA